MCCDACPKYEDCEVRDKLKERCCKLCPEYNTCHSSEENEDDIEEVGF